jgi:hypothetical protein
MIDFIEVKIKDIDRLRKFCDDFIECKNIKSKKLLPWYYTPQTTSDKFPQLSHGMLSRKDDRPLSQYFDFFNEIVYTTLRGLDIEYSGCIRACLNMTYHIPGYEFFDPHVDNYDTHYSTILYLNESDGNTVIFDAEHEEGKGDEIYVNGHEYKLDNGTLYHENIDWKNHPLPIKHEVEPEFGKMLIFNGKYLHSLRPPSPGKLRVISVLNVGI